MNDKKNESYEDSSIVSSKIDQQNERTDTSNVSQSRSPPVQSNSSSGKRNRRWQNNEDFNERQKVTQQNNAEDELRMIAERSTPPTESTIQSNDIPQPPIVIQTETNVTKSKWDDDDDDDDEMTNDSINKNATPSES